MKSWPLILSVLTWLFSIAPAFAVVGELDTGNLFPYVVRLNVEWRDGSGAWCSGAVSGHILSTAAHCVYNSDRGTAHGWAKNISITYQDVLGEDRTALGRRFYITHQWRTFADSGRDYDFDVAPHDIAYVVLDTEVLTAGYIHWGVELLQSLPDGKSDCAEPECMDWSLVGERRPGFLENVSREFGNLSAVEMAVVGYGNFICDNYNDREENCRSDGRRRFVRLTLQPGITATSPPWIWCTGQSNAKTNPIQHGDSGGAVLAKARDGRWVFVGYTSGGNSLNGCASSMFNNLNLWRDAIAAYDFGKVKGAPTRPSRRELAVWYRTVAQQFLKEWLFTEGSADVSVALKRYADPNPPVRSASWADAKIYYFGREITHEALYEKKQRFFEKWPVRAFNVSQPSIRCTLSDFTTSNVCAVSFAMNWQLRNPSDNSDLTGRSNLTLRIQMPFVDSKAISLNDFDPILVSIDGDPYDGTPPSPKTSIVAIKSVKSNVSDGYLNLRNAPGLSGSIVASIPAGAGEVAVTGKCVPAVGRKTRYPWCPVRWNGVRGWVSANGLE